MTKEELRDRMFQLTDTQAYGGFLLIDKILALINEAGYVKLADDQSLPEQLTWCSLDGVAIQGATSVYTIAQRDMLKEGWRKVEIWESP